MVMDINLDPSKHYDIREPHKGVFENKIKFLDGGMQCIMAFQKVVK
jgi:hypothetical protein